jgi:hypothetical protein
MIKFLLAAAALVALSTQSLADPPRLYDRETGKFLGNLSANRFDPDSVNNPHGIYGSEHSVDSINNEFGQYGSPHSLDSPNNPFGTNPPVIYGDDD